MASTADNSDTALLTEHFGYPPVSLLDDIINTVNLLAEKALDNVEQGLLAQPPETLGFRPPPAARGGARPKKDAGAPPPQPGVAEAARHEIENGTHQLETLLCASIDRNFDKFELYVLRNVLCVRPADRDWMRLGHYEGLDLGAAARPDAPSPASLSRLRARLQASQRLNCMLHAERARNEALLAELRAVVGAAPAPAAAAAAAGVKKEEGADGEEEKGEGEGAAEKAAAAAGDPRPALAFLHDKGDLAVGDADTPLTTNTAFTLSQLQALRALSTSLRTMRPDLRGPQGGGGGASAAAAEGAEGGRRGWRRERLEYVEGAARRHLEHVRQLELGDGGEVRDGEWQGEGRKLGKGEAGELEAVASLLGVAAQASGPKGEDGDGDGDGEGEDRMDES